MKKMFAMKNIAKVGDAFFPLFVQRQIRRKKKQQTNGMRIKEGKKIILLIFFLKFAFIQKI